MPQSPDTSVSIIFRTPVGDHKLFHERTLRVPLSTAQEIEEDFLQYRNSKLEVSRYQTYRYRKDGENQLIAIDLTEVATVFV